MKFLIFLLAIGLSFDALNLIKWRDVKGEHHNFHLVTRASKYWKRIGLRLGYSTADLKTIEDDQGGNDQLCWCYLMEKWLCSNQQAQKTPSYPVSWKGLHSMLIDAEASDVAKCLRVAVTRAIPFHLPAVSPPTVPTDVEDNASSE